MKQIINFIHPPSGTRFATIVICILLAMGTYAQDTTETVAATTSNKPVKNTFGSVLIIDNQTVMVPIKGTFEMVIQHRFGTWENGFDDMWGLYAPSNIRLGVNYAPVEKLYLGFGMTKDRKQFDFSAKYALLKQSSSMPVSLTYYGDMSIDGRDESNFRYTADRFSYINQLILARKISDKFSVQVAPSLSWFNNVEGYVDSKGEIQDKMNHEHFAVALYGRYKIGNNTAILAGWDQPLTQHPTNNPQPNICLGLELTTSSHAFQIFAGNYHGIIPQSNNVYNQNDYREGQFLIGFNISRLWNF